MTPSDDPIALTVHSLPEPGQMRQQERTARGRRVMLLVVLACALPVLASYFTFYVIKPTGAGSAYGQLIAPPVAMPDLAAGAIDGQAVPLRSLKGQWLLLVASGGDCDSVCEKRLFMQRQLREMLGRERDRIDKVWLVIDDAPIKPALQQALLATPSVRILRLPRAQALTWLSPAPGQALEEHFYIVDPMGLWMMREPANPEPGRVKRDLDRLLRASGSWDKPGR